MGEQKKREIFIDGDVLKYASIIIDEVKKVGARKVWYGEYHVDRVTIWFDGESTNYEVGYNADMNGYGLYMVDPYVYEVEDF